MIRAWEAIIVTLTILNILALWVASREHRKETAYKIYFVLASLPFCWHLTAFVAFVLGNEQLARWPTRQFVAQLLAIVAISVFFWLKNGRQK